MNSTVPTFKPHESQIVKIEKEGKFGTKTQREYKKELKWEELKELQSKAKTFEKYLTSCIKLANFEQNLDIARLLEFLRDKHKEYEKVGKARIKSWKGRSPLEYVKHLDKIVVTKFQREDKDSIPKKTDYTITKEELNGLLSALNICQNLVQEGFIPTQLIEEQVCRVLKIEETPYKEKLFENNRFIYSHFTRWRIAHYRITLILNVLSEEGWIEYRKKGTKIIRTIPSVEEVLA